MKNLWNASRIIADFPNRLVFSRQFYYLFTVFINV